MSQPILVKRFKPYNNDSLFGISLNIHNRMAGSVQWRFWPHFILCYWRCSWNSNTTPSVSSPKPIWNINIFPLIALRKDFPEWSKSGVYFLRNQNSYQTLADCKPIYRPIYLADSSCNWSVVKCCRSRMRRSCYCIASLLCVWRTIIKHEFTYVYRCLLIIHTQTLARVVIVVQTPAHTHILTHTEVFVPHSNKPLLTRISRYRSAVCFSAFSLNRKRLVLCTLTTSVMTWCEIYLLTSHSVITKRL